MHSTYDGWTDRRQRVLLQTYRIEAIEPSRERKTLGKGAYTVYCKRLTFFFEIMMYSPDKL